MVLAAAASITAVGSSGSHTLQILAANAGDYFAIEVLDRGKLGIAQTHSDPGIATDLAAIANESNVWYGLLTLFNSAALVTAAAGYAESTVKLYGADTIDTLVASQAFGVGSDVAQTLQAATRKRTTGFFHPSADEFAAAAQMGRFFPISPGGDNWRLKALSGVTTKSYTSSEVTNLNNKFCNFYYNINNSPNGAVIGGNGKVFSGQYVDVIRGTDWYAARLQTRLVNVFIQREKVEFDDDGINVLAGELKAMNQEGITAKLIAPSPKPRRHRTARVEAFRRPTKRIELLNGLSTTWTLACHHQVRT